MADSIFASFGGLMETDLSVQVLNAIFGSGWHSLTAQSGTGSAGVLGELLFSLFGVLNCCCALVAAWLFILTTLSATLGAAQDGQGIAGRRYSNAWIPVRYSFALGAVTPVFNGLNAMQMLMLSCIGLSVQFADAMWSAGIEQLSKTEAVLARSQPVTAASAGRVLPVLMEHHVLRKYFSEQERCAFSEGDSREYEGWSKNRYRISLELPRLMHCPNLRGDDGYGMTLNPALHFGDFGGMHVSTPVRGASEALAKAFAPGGALYRATEESVARALASDGTNLYAACDLGGLARLYQETVSSSLKEAVQNAMNDRQSQLARYVQDAASQGWWMAGSYYWTLAKLAADSVEAMQDRTEAVPVNVQALADFMNPDLERALGVARELGIRTAQLAGLSQSGNPVSGSLPQGRAEEAASQEEGGLGGRLGNFFSGASHAISEFALDEKAVGTGLVQVIAGHDLVFNVVRASRVVMNVCENAVAAYVGLSVASRSLGALVRNPVTAAVS
ncbi:MAG: DotA/TraY family protein, partial [Desulfovibrionaceae bacterium]|nr:DotA/TraY family protein [Desulfovibrionaceae bacterium]